MYLSYLTQTLYHTERMVEIVCRLATEEEAGSDPAIARTKSWTQDKCAQGETKSNSSRTPIYSHRSTDSS